MPEKKSLRIIFMGTPDFAVPSLKALLNSPDEVVAVVTQPDRPRGRGRVLTPSPVKVEAQAASIPVLQPEKIRDEDFAEQLRKLDSDIIVVVAYGRILPKHIIELPPLGTINVHGSLLPKYRGAAPIQWAVINGETETGVTIMQMDEGLDTGDILYPAGLAIGPDDTAGSLFEKLAELGGKTLIEALALMKKGKLVPRKQDDSLASLAPPLTKEQGLVDWSKPATTISCLIRGLDPWPSTYTFLDKKRVRLFSPEVAGPAIQLKDSDTPPGTLCRADDNGLLISTGEGLLFIREIQFEGSKRMAVKDFLRGRKLEPGIQFGH
jgi:methionyl-tRNA formyltransferase